MALVTTFATTPLTSILYPTWYQQKLQRWKRGEIDWDGNELLPSDTSSDREDDGPAKWRSIRKLLVHLRFDNMPSLLTFISLLGSQDSSDKPEPKQHPLHQQPGDAQREGKTLAHNDSSIRRQRPLQVHGVRLVELTERNSSVMQVVDDYTLRDPVVNTFRTFGQLNNVAASGAVAIVPERSYADTLVGRASELSSDFLLVPWSETGAMSEQHSIEHGSPEERFINSSYTSFVSEVLKTATSRAVGVLVNRGFGGPSLDQHYSPTVLGRTVSGISFLSGHDERPTPPISNHHHHVFLPYFGGADDHFALRFVLQLAQSENVTATVLYVNINPDTSESIMTSDKENDRFVFTSTRENIAAHPSLSARVVCTSLTLSSTNKLFPTVLTQIKAEVGLSPSNAGDLVVLGRDSALPGFARSKSGGLGVEARAALGWMADAVLGRDSEVKASVLVVQAKRVAEGFAVDAAKRAAMGSLGA